MKMFVLMPSDEAAQGGSYPMVACDDEDFAADRQDVHHHVTLIYSEKDQIYIEGLEVGGKYYDGQGWQWWRANDRF